MSSDTVPTPSDAMTQAIARKDVGEVGKLGLARSETINDPTEAAHNLLDLARWLEDQDARDIAIALRLRALELLAGGNADPRLVAVESMALADLFEASGDLNKATAWTDSAVALTRKCEGEDSGAYHERLHQLADRAEQDGDAVTSDAARDEADTLARRYDPNRRRQGSFPIDAAKPDLARPTAVQIPILYATNRDVKKTTDLYARFGRDRNEQTNYGIARVSVPGNRRSGKLALPNYFWQFSDAYESDNLFLLKGLQALSTRAAWLEHAREQVQLGTRREILLYVHGFNTEFWEAMLRAAQLHVDLGIDGATAAYSWPSRGSSWSYDVDRTSIDVFWPQLKDLIVELARPFAVSDSAQVIKPRLIVVAHSMGCDYTLKALERLALEWATGRFWQGAAPIDELIFASPDVDLAVFRRDVLPVAALASRVTAYCSEADVALWLSKTRIHRYERAGRKAESLLGLKLDGIDTTTAAGSRLWEFAHNDYATSALIDIKAVLCGDTLSQRLHLEPASVAEGIYWSLMPNRLTTAEGQAYVQSVDSRRGTTRLPVPLTT